MIVTIAFGAVGGAVSGAYYADRLANERARRRRKVKLVGFLNAWRSEVEEFRTKYSPNANVWIGVVEGFEQTRLEMVAKAAVVELDYGGTSRAEFKALVDNVSKFPRDDINLPSRRKDFADKIAAVVTFVENDLSGDFPARIDSEK